MGETIMTFWCVTLPGANYALHVVKHGTLGFELASYGYSPSVYPTQPIWGSLPQYLPPTACRMWEEAGRALQPQHDAVAEAGAGHQEQGSALLRPGPLLSQQGALHQVDRRPARGGVPGRHPPRTPGPHLAVSSTSTQCCLVSGHPGCPHTSFMSTLLSL